MAHDARHPCCLLPVQKQGRIRPEFVHCSCSPMTETHGAPLRSRERDTGSIRRMGRRITPRGRAAPDLVHHPSFEPGNSVRSCQPSRSTTALYRAATITQARRWRNLASLARVPRRRWVDKMGGPGLHLSATGPDHWRQWGVFAKPESLERTTATLLGRSRPTI